MASSDTVDKVRNSIALVITLNAQNKVTGKGSGFVFYRPGLLVTCNHVVGSDDNVKIRLVDSSADFIEAKVAIRDEEHDLALLKYDATKSPDSLPLKPLEQSKIIEGIPVLFAGYPLGLFTLTTHQGLLSGITKDSTGITTYLIDGTVNSGNSGCPLMDQDGNVIGVVNAKRRERNDLLNRVEELQLGALSLHGIDLVELYQALISNVQLGMGYAVPCSYIPSYKETEEPVVATQAQAKQKREKK